MSIFTRIKGLFAKEKASGYLSRSDLGVVGRIFGSNWTDAQYLQTYGKSLYVYACVSKLAETLGSIDFQLVKIKNSAGEVEEVKNHEILDILYNWNPYYTKAEAIEIDTINRQLTGDSFILKVRNNNGRVVELWNIRPDLVTIKGHPEKYIDYYEIRNTDDGTAVIVQPGDIIHIKHPSPLEQYFGMSPLSAAQVRVDIEDYASEYQRDFYLNQARPDALIEIDRNITPEQKKQLIEGWEKRHGGLGSNSKIGLLTGGARYHQISLSQREMDYIESMKATRDDILVAFKTPKPIVAVTDSTGRSRAEAEVLQEIYLSGTVIPEIKRLVDKLNEQFVIPEYGEEYELRFIDPVPDSREYRLAEFTAGCDRWLTANEIRADLGKDPIEGGDVLYRPLGVMPAGEPMPVRTIERNFKNLHGKRKLRIKMDLEDSIRQKAKEVNDEITKEYGSGSLFKDIDRRRAYHEKANMQIDRRAAKMERGIINIKNEQKNDFLKRYKKSKPRTKKDLRTVFNFRQENKRLAEWILPYLNEFYMEAGKEAMELLTSEPFQVEKAMTASELLKLLEKRAVFFAKSVNETTFQALAKTLSEGIEEGESIDKLTKRVNNIYKDFNQYRAATITRTETNNVVNEANLQAYEQAGAQGKEWIATLDDRVRDEHLLMDGEIVGIRENFSNGLPAPGEINCRCVIAPVRIIV